MARKKLNSAIPPAQVRPIHCAFCQKELNPTTDQVTFIGVGKWRDGPGYFHAVCSAKTPEGEESPCFINGMSWATNLVKQQPTCMTYDEWKARPVRRHVSATRAANGRYELRLTESHLNCIFFLETKHAPNAEKAKMIVERWQSDWNLEPEDVPDIDGLERDGRQEREVQRLQAIPQIEDQSEAARSELPEALREEIHRHLQKHMKHRLADLRNRGDNCKSCRISRGMQKLYAYSVWVPVLEETLDTMRTIKGSVSSALFMKDVLEFYNKAMKSLRFAFDIKEDDEAHNDAVRKRNEADIRSARSWAKKHNFDV